MRNAQNVLPTLCVWPALSTIAHHLLPSVNRINWMNIFHIWYSCLRVSVCVLHGLFVDSTWVSLRSVPRPPLSSNALGLHNNNWILLDYQCWHWEPQWLPDARLKPRQDLGTIYLCNNYITIGYFHQSYHDISIHLNVCWPKWPCIDIHSKRHCVEYLVYFGLYWLFATLAWCLSTRIVPTHTLWIIFCTGLLTCTRNVFLCSNLNVLHRFYINRWRHLECADVGTNFPKCQR